MRNLGISLPSVRKAYAALRRYLDTAHPFSHQDLRTDGHKLFIFLKRQSQSDSELIEIVSRQHAIPQILLPYLERVIYGRGSRLARQWNISDGVIVDPARALGKPIVAACAMSTSVLAASFDANGRSAVRVADWYGVTPADVESAVRFEGRYFRTTA